MAVHCSSPADYLKRLTNIVQPSSAYTCIFWTRFNGGTAGSIDRVLFSTIHDPLGTYDYYADISTASPSGLDVQVAVGNGVSFPGTTTKVFTDGIWYPVAYTRSGSTHNFYVSGVFIGSASCNVSAGTFDWLSLGTDLYDDGTLALEFASFKEWDTTLNFNQINEEINSPSAVINTTNLVTFTPLVSDLLDISGNGNDWTAVGSPTFVANPSFPSNSSAANAQTISSLPFSASANASISGIEYTFDLWYKYTAVSGDNEIGAFGFGDLSTYRPIVNVFSPDSSTDYPPPGGLASQNCPIQIPVTSGIDYYFYFFPNSRTIAGTLTLTCEAFVDSAVPIGSIAVNDDTQGFPLALLDSSVDRVLRFIQDIPAGEAGTILPDGTLLLEDATAGNCKLFDSNYNLIATVALNNIKYIGYDAAGTQFLVCWKNGSNHYVCNFVDKLGNIGATTYDLGTSAVTNCVADATYIYYQQTANTTVKRWTIATNSAGTDLVSGSAASVCKDIIILGDGTLLVAYLASNNVKRYDNTGSLLNTYTPGFTGNTSDRMAPDTSDSYFKYWSQNSTDPSVFYTINTSDGTFTTKDQTIFEAGAYEGVPTATPTALFGCSESCPFWVTRVQNGGTIVVGKGSNPLATGNFTVTGPNGTFTIETDTAGEEISVPAGTYSVTEAANANYVPSYFVSNDPVNNDNEAVVVANGELVDVVIVNSLATKYGGLYQRDPSLKHDVLQNQDGTTTTAMINWFYELFTNRDK